ncbi:MAG: glycosyltransferase family 2 protein [Deltaproteobacteria bacterium]|nr:glycosyltransferase family 2 protein [Deltaproteobacteria bacterium]
MSLDIIILTKNEARNITACLNSFKGFGQAIVVDDESSDETVALAEAVGAKVFSRKMDNYSAQRNFALEQSEADWVFFLDADERFTPGLKEGIERHIAGKPAAGEVLRVNYAFGRRFRFGHLAPDRVARLFPKGHVRWEGLVHESAKTDLPTKKISGYEEHYTYGNWEHFLGKMERYSRLWAKEAAEKGRSCCAFVAVIRAFLNFFKMFVIKLGFLDGPAGWAICLVSAYYTLSKYLILSDLNCVKALKER